MLMLLHECAACYEWRNGASLDHSPVKAPLRRLAAQQHPFCLSGQASGSRLLLLRLQLCCLTAAVSRSPLMLPAERQIRDYALAYTALQAHTLQIVISCSHGSPGPGDSGLSPSRATC